MLWLMIWSMTEWNSLYNKCSESEFEQPFENKTQILSSFRIFASIQNPVNLGMSVKLCDICHSKSGQKKSKFWASDNWDDYCKNFGWKINL